MKIEIREQEEWRPIPGHPAYEASTLGNVRSYWGRLGQGKGWGLKDTPIILKAHVNTQTGYPTVVLSSGNGNRVQKSVHVLVALAFLGRPPTESHCVRHMNGIRTDPRLSNLAYGTASENQADRALHGTVTSPLKAADVLKIRQLSACGEPESALAHQFGVTPKTIRRINLRRRWASI